MKILDQHTGELIFVPNGTLEKFFPLRKKQGLLEIETPDGVHTGDYDNYGGITINLHEPVYVCRRLQRYKKSMHMMLRVTSGSRVSEMARAVGAVLTELEETRALFSV